MTVSGSMIKKSDLKSILFWLRKIWAMELFMNFLKSLRCRCFL